MKVVHFHRVILLFAVNFRVDLLQRSR